jgi:phospholipid/cholesterol/gamma-HCH transport system ATP-binding protein
MENEILLRLENISFQSDEYARVEGVSFQLRRGQNLVVFGTEDSGIDTLCPLIAGIMPPLSGEIFFKGKSLREFNYTALHNYRRELGYLQSDYGLISNMSVEENISLPLRYHSKVTDDEVRHIVNDYIGLLSLEGCRNKRPVWLRKSEILRTAFARAVALDPDLLLIEHSLAGQCPLNAQIFLRELKNWAGRDGRSLFITTYTPELYKEFSDYYIMLSAGKIVFSGTRDEYFSSENPSLAQYRRSSLDGPIRIM